MASSRGRRSRSSVKRFRSADLCTLSYMTDQPAVEDSINEVSFAAEAPLVTDYPAEFDFDVVLMDGETSTKSHHYGVRTPANQRAYAESCPIRSCQGFT